MLMLVLGSFKCFSFFNYWIPHQSMLNSIQYIFFRLKAWRSKHKFCALLFVISSKGYKSFSQIAIIYFIHFFFFIKGPNKWVHLAPPTPCCLPSGPWVTSSSLAAVRGGRATLRVRRESKTAASSQAQEAILSVVSSAPHTPLLHLPLDTDPIWGGPPDHQLLRG